MPRGEMFSAEFMLYIKGPQNVCEDIMPYGMKLNAGKEKHFSDLLSLPPGTLDAICKLD